MKKLTNVFCELAILASCVYNKADKSLVYGKEKKKKTLMYISHTIAWILWVSCKVMNSKFAFDRIKIAIDICIKKNTFPIRFSTQS